MAVTGNEQFEGFIVDLMDMIADKLNFTFTLVEFKEVE